MRIIIVGGGKIGYYLTVMLKDLGHDVTVIEIDKARSQVFANDIDAQVIWGNGTNDKVLGIAGAKDSDALIAVTGRDEDNLIACQIAKKIYRIEKTVAKVNNPKNEAPLKQLGVDFVVSATDNIIRQLEREVDNSRIKSLLQLNEGEAAVFEVKLPENYALDRHTLIDIPLPENCNIISITRDGRLIIPRGKTKLLSKDTLLIVAATNGVNDVRKALKIKK